MLINIIEKKKKKKKKKEKEGKIQNHANITTLFKKLLFAVTYLCELVNETMYD
jgi:hypothetical protein